MLSNISNALQNAASSFQVSNVLLSGMDTIRELTEEERETVSMLFLQLFAYS